MTTTQATKWEPLGPDVQAALRQNHNPMQALADGDIPAVVLRGIYPSEQCRRLVARFYERDLVPGLPRPGESIAGKIGFERVDVGTSLGNLFKDPAKFFESAAGTNELYRTLFDGLISPIQVMYDAISALAPGKRAVTAHEDDGRPYGPVIFRCHMPHWGYPPHIDSVRRRTKLTNYAVHRFKHQMAAILLLQPPQKASGGVDSILYRSEWDQDIARREGKDFGDLGAMNADAWHAYARERGIAQCGVGLSEGDLYIFKSEGVHEVPGFTGDRPRIVMATFFGYSPDLPEIYVWS
ncbi:MAG: hypothetical protein IT441_07085 [Phycisphaeraceae bacterium]|nr:hypothetical protein [Phycisphaeraceae bacterium]